MKKKILFLTYNSLRLWGKSGTKPVMKFVDKFLIYKIKIKNKKNMSMMNVC